MNIQKAIKILNFILLISIILGFSLLFKKNYNLYNTTGVISIPFILGQILGIAVIPCVVLIIIIVLKRKLKSNNIFETNAYKSDEVVNLEKNAKMIKHLEHDKVLTSIEATIKLNEISEKLGFLKIENNTSNNNVILEQIINYKHVYARYMNSHQNNPFWKVHHDSLITEQQDLSAEILDEVHREYQISNKWKHDAYNQCLIILILFSISESSQFIVFRAGLALAGLFYFLHINYQLNRCGFKFLKIKYIVFRPIAFSCLFVRNLYIGLPNNEQAQIEIDNGTTAFQMFSVILIFFWTFDKSLNK